MRASYLGSGLDPDTYYRRLAGSYVNPHAAAAIELVRGFQEHLRGTVLDLGCGSGLATKALSGKRVVGVDRSAEMVARYVAETGSPGHVGNFWDELPKADSAMVVHALHLCPESRLHEFRWRLKEAGVQTLVVVSPLKRAGTLGLPLRASKTAAGPNGKTVWGWAFEVSECELPLKRAGS